jgi:hypothetical protein
MVQRQRYTRFMHLHGVFLQDRRRHFSLRREHLRERTEVLWDAGWLLLGSLPLLRGPHVCREPMRPGMIP